jgi:hypothetical protein
LLATIIAAIVLLGFVFTRSLVDFPVYYSAGRSLLSGRTDLYSPDFAQGRVMDYRYPPFFLVALIPLWLLAYPVAAYAWYLTSVLQIIGCAFILRRKVHFNQSVKAAWLIIIFAVCQYLVMNLHYGNAHLLAIFLLFASFYFVATRHVFIAALAMSLAITIKLTPLIILPYFALKKWRFLSLVAAMLVAINLAPAAYFGFTKNAQLLKSWYEHVIADQEFHEINGPINLSLKGQMRRYFSPVDYSERVDGDVRYPSINVAAFSSEKIENIWRALAAVTFLSLLALVWSGRKKAGLEADRAIGTCNDLNCEETLELSLMVCGMLFIEPLTSKIYFVALLWPVVSLAAFAFNNSTAAARHVRRVLMLVAVINSALPLLPGRSVQRLLLVLGVDFYANCLLMAAVIYALIALRREPQARSGGPQIQALSAAKTS